MVEACLLKLSVRHSLDIHSDMQKIRMNLCGEVRVTWSDNIYELSVGHVVHVHNLQILIISICLIIINDISVWNVGIQNFFCIISSLAFWCYALYWNYLRTIMQI